VETLYIKAMSDAKSPLSLQESGFLSDAEILKIKEQVRQGFAALPESKDDDKASDDALRKQLEEFGKQAESLPATARVILRFPQGKVETRRKEFSYCPYCGECLRDSQYKKEEGV